MIHPKFFDVYIMQLNFIRKAYIYLQKCSTFIFFFKSDRLTNLDFVVIKKNTKKFQTKIYTLAHLRICASLSTLSLEIY